MGHCELYELRILDQVYGVRIEEIKVRTHCTSSGVLQLILGHRNPWSSH